MNGNVYEDQPTLTPIKTSPSSTPVTTSSASSTSPVTSQSGPLHIPAKRLGYECVEGSGVIRHSHHGHWNYSSGEYDQYSQPTYYNLPDGRDRKTGLFWSPAASQDYKYTTSVTPGTSADPAVSTCHQTSFGQTWCNYPPYSSRHHVEAPYLPGEDRRVAMVETAAGFGHDSYPLRNYPPHEPVPSTPYPPPGKNFTLTNFRKRKKNLFLVTTKVYDAEMLEQVLGSGL